MSRIKPPSNLPELVKTAFAKARDNGDLHYYPTQVAVLNANNIPFQLRFSPALASKPKAPQPDPSLPHKPFDPFANPPAALRVTDLGSSHFVVLNKFAVVPQHFILATTEFKPQTHLLEPSDLEATLACIEAYENDAQTQDEPSPEESSLFVFFNSGNHSGASQPHRHLQLLPVARMRDGLEPAASWSVLADHLDIRRPPFATFSEHIRVGMTGQELHDVYIRLYRRACRLAAAAKDQGNGDVASDGEAAISYNMAMTKSSLVICPRTAEGMEIRGPEGEGQGKLALNGTLLAGTALVKNQAEWEALQEDENALLRVLQGIGIPPDSEETTRL